MVLMLTDKCLSRSPDIELKIIENIYEMIVESSLMYGIQVRVIHEGWENKYSWEFF
jgi:hypothetical protein